MTRITLPATAALALTACQNAPPETAPPPPVTASLCDAAKVQDVLGKVRSDDLMQDARKRSGAAIVRYLTPGTVVTMEYRGDRLNLYVHADGKIASARCG